MLRAYPPPSISISLMTNSISFSIKPIVAVTSANLTSWSSFYILPLS
nr:MAG TPA: hypothetical protein [Caudoviricetes sp.]